MVSEKTKPFEIKDKIPINNIGKTKTNIFFTTKLIAFWLKVNALKQPREFIRQSKIKPTKPPDQTLPSVGKTKADNKAAEIKIAGKQNHMLDIVFLRVGI